MRRASTTLILALFGLAAAAYAANAVIATDLLPDEIQEDWQIVIGVPDPVGAGPQISTLMNPVADGSTPFFVFNVNYGDFPTFTPGGFQAQAWSEGVVIAAATKGTEQCSTTGETITWTQDMKLSPGVISFSINSGRSTTWGDFGQGQELDLSGVNFPSGLTSLSAYSPAVSVAGSGVGWERNRVTSMTLLEVRYYAAGKLLSTDRTSRPIDLTK